MKRLLLVFIALLVAACATTPQIADLTVTHPQVDGPIFGTTMKAGTPDAAYMKEHGYTEEEVFVSGKANLYRYGADGRPEAATKDIPYTTRVLIIRPIDRTKFSGRAIIEPYHPGAAAISWGGMREFTVRNGDVYVGVFVGGASSRGAAQMRAMAGASGGAMPVIPPAALANMRRMDALASLRESAPARYAAIVWPDNNGISWDVFGSVAQLLRSDSQSNPLRDFPVKRMYATGWSATGSFLRTYTNEGFHERYRKSDGRPTIDGYVIGISQGSFIAGYNSIADDVPVIPPTDSRRWPRAIDAPFIEIMSENEAVTKVGPPVLDSDANPGRHRYYELPGTTHTDAMGGAASPNFMSQCTLPASDVPFLYLTYAAFENAQKWVNDGVAPPRQTKPMTVVPQSGGPPISAKDDLGNATGGIRTAEVEVPLARYGISGDPKCASPMPAALMEMRRNALDRSVLTRLYPGGSAEYLRKYEARLDQLIAERWILAKDKPAMMTHAREAAAAAFK
jgi:hypothetical protein